MCFRWRRSPTWGRARSVEVTEMAEWQLSIDFDYDERVPSLARELAIMVTPHVAPGTPTETVKTLAERIAKLAEQRFKYFGEPSEPIRCHLCDNMTVPKDRVRVAVCVRCSLSARTAGSDG